MHSAQGSPSRITLLFRVVNAYIRGNLMISRAVSARTLKERTMFNTLFAKRRRRTFQWKPAVDLTNPRVAASLITFPTN